MNPKGERRRGPDQGPRDAAEGHDEPTTRRALRPRTALSVHAEFVSDLSAPAVVGLEPRVFRELVRDLAVPHLRRGQRVLVDVRVFREAIDKVVRVGSPVGESVAGGATEPTSSQLLASVGRVRRAG